MKLPGVGRAVRTSIAAVTLCCFLQPAIAETWVSVHSSDNRMDWIDRDSLKIRHGLWSAWTRTQFAEPQRRPQDGIVFKSARTLVYFDCDARRMGFASVVFYSDPSWKNVIGDIDAPDIKKISMEAAPPGSQGAELMESGCSHR